jgi:hypothetical protein
MEFIFMLTRDDRTVPGALDVLDAIRPLGLRHIGFKDMGLEPARMRELNLKIKAQGATSWLEVVGTAPGAALAGARSAVAIGVDRLLGGTDRDADAVLAALAGTEILFFPFPGAPHGHPTVLGGRPEEIAADCALFRAKGCAGVDLLAFRASEAEPLELVRAARGALGDRMLVVAGSIDQPARVRALALAGADAFTIGSAIFKGTFAPRRGALVPQLQAVLAACRELA